MRIVGILATLVVFGVGFWAKVKYSEVEAQIPGNDNVAEVAEMRSDSEGSDSAVYGVIDSVMSWFTSTGDGSTTNPYTGNEAGEVDLGHVETNKFFDEPSK